MEADDEVPVELPIDGVLDLHAFRPRDVRILVPEYLACCRGRGIREVRIVHGKGDGTLRRTVHALLERDPAVLGYGLAGPDAGGWGATLATLAPPRSARARGSVRTARAPSSESAP